MKMSGKKVSGKANPQKGAKANMKIKPTGQPLKVKPVPQKGFKGQQNEAKPSTGQKVNLKSTEKSGNKLLQEMVSKKKELSKEDKAALTIQCAFRQHLARRKKAQHQKEQQEYEKLMEQLQKEAFVAMVRKEQEEAERQRLKEEEERKKKREEQLRKKRILEAAFEGDVADILAVLKEVSDADTKNGIGYDDNGKRIRFCTQMNMIECRDANQNTPLSEAASGGHPEVIKLLIEKGAEVNSKGAYGRTPLFRAAFGGHISAVEVLLQYGADPRIYADDGNTPEQVASLDSIISILKNWDIKMTDSMLTKMEAEKQRRAAEEQKQKEAAAVRLTSDILQLTKEHNRCQKELQQAYCELNKRITEHDKCERKNMNKREITLQAIHDAEFALESLRTAVRQAEERLTAAKLQLREQTQEGDSCLLKGIKCSVKELDDVLLKDAGKKIQEEKRWPVIIDPSGMAATFLRYRDTNYLDTLNPHDMQTESIRLALLGSIRYGKPLVFDMMEVNMLDVIKTRFDEIQNGLLDELLDKKLIKNERYLSLLRPTDSPEYSRNQFMETRMEKFKLFVLTKLQNPPESLLNSFYPIEVFIPSSRPQ
ncbi:IQ motif and ankyrin repeat domain-containing protein 1 [Protopterus annectens]|uniref:IQ motif and ankyrin repeat domain-containing protein 1 n=1 Tax=Protopterus annectens TaxID=7888 RepID=UPI001CFA0E4C|nr:IQ motif and ankyrin repeat domain-containing protein 1 [Protopterus annectens]